MKQLNKRVLQELKTDGHLILPNVSQFDLPEKIVQFGTGVLLRGLPDQYVQEANNRGEFNGRIVVVKSTATGNVSDFIMQDGVYTVCTRGIEDGELVNRYSVNATISRVLNAASEWQQVLDLAKSDSLEIVTSNTTEVGMLYQEENIIHHQPESFPGRLLQILYTRYQHYKGDSSKGLVIIPAELIEHNADVLRSVLLQLAAFNSLPVEFTEWLSESNYFCNTLVDRIVPGKLNEALQKEAELQLGFEDRLMIMAEPFGLWAIESVEPRVKETLSFCNTHTGCKVVPSIEKFKELKLRLLNASHSFACGVSIICGITYVRESMKDALLASFIKKLAVEEIAQTIAGESIKIEEAKEFAQKVLDRFSNPYLDHQWKSISAQFSLKVKVRCIPLMIKYVQKFNNLPTGMLIGFAAFLVSERIPLEELATLLGDEDKWGADLASIQGLVIHVHELINRIQQEELVIILKKYTGET